MTESTTKEESNKILKNDLQEKPTKGLGLRTHVSLLPKVKTLHQEKKGSHIYHLPN